MDAFLNRSQAAFCQGLGSIIVGNEFEQAGRIIELQSMHKGFLFGRFLLGRQGEEGLFLDKMLNGFFQPAAKEFYKGSGKLIQFFLQGLDVFEPSDLLHNLNLAKRLFE